MLLLLLSFTVHWLPGNFSQWRNETTNSVSQSRVSCSYSLISNQYNNNKCKGIVNRQIDRYLWVFQISKAKSIINSMIWYVHCTSVNKIDWATAIHHLPSYHKFINKDDNNSNTFDLTSCGIIKKISFWLLTISNWPMSSSLLNHFFYPLSSRTNKRRRRRRRKNEHGVWI